MDNINLLFAGNSAEYSIDLAKRFLESGNINSAVILYYYYYGDCTEWKEFDMIKDCKNPDISLISMEYEYRYLYALDKETHKYPALDKELLELMLPYESYAIKTARRRYGNFPVVEYEEAKRDYHTILRFWSNIFKRKMINAVYFETLPHMTTTYVIYGLARIYDIPILMAVDSYFDLRKTYGYGSIESAGNNIKEYYEQNYDNIDSSIDSLEEDFRSFYKRFTQKADTISKERKNSKYYKKLLKEEKERYFSGYVGLRSLFKPLRHTVQTIVKSLIASGNLKLYKEQKYWLKSISKRYCYSEYYKRHLATTLRKYDSFAMLPNDNEKFIFFGLQLTPEATTMPQAGVFSEQYTSIQLLARAAEPLGIKVYVKEHFVQAFREKAVYDLIKSIPNVRIIKSSVNSFELIENCIAVSTQTGTVILESSLHGKPVLVTSSGYNYKGIPNLYEISDEEQGTEIIQMILDGSWNNNRSVAKYFHAMQENTMYFYRIRDKKAYNSEDYKRSLSNQQDILKEFLLYAKNKISIREGYNND